MDILQALLGNLVQDNAPYVWPNEMNPPAEFLEAGRAALDQGRVQMFGYPPWRVTNICARNGVVAGGSPTLGCAVPAGDGSWRVYYNGRLPETLRQRVIDHELAHTGSWNPEHDGS